MPNYFIGRTRTADGVLSDPVNLSVRGSEEKLHKAMTEAGWVLADDITPRSAWKWCLRCLVVVAIQMRQCRPHFCLVGGRILLISRKLTAIQGVVIMLGLAMPTGWLLPGGHRVDWLAAGTYDKSVGFSLFTFQFTHKIDENIDIERDYIIESVKSNNKMLE